MPERVRSLLLAIATSNGFLPDSPSVTPDPSPLSPHYADPSEQNSASFFIHHTGTALIQPVVQHSQAHSTTTRATGHSSWHRSQHNNNSSRLLYPTSTPLTRSPSKQSHTNTREEDTQLSTDAARATECEGETQGGAAASDGERGTGFYWHRNCLLPKQKNVPQGLLAQYDSVLERLTRNCQNHDQILDQLCKRLFT